MYRLIECEYCHRTVVVQDTLDSRTGREMYLCFKNYCRGAMYPAEDADWIYSIDE